MVKTYTFDDVVNALNQVAFYDWRGFWTERLSNHGPGARSAESKEADGNWCTTRILRTWIAPEIVTGRTWMRIIRWDCWLRAMGNSRYGRGHACCQGRDRAGDEDCRGERPQVSGDVWHDAIRAAKTSPSPIELIVENTDYFRVVKLDYRGGEKYPHLVRDEAKPDLLTEIYRAK